MMQRINKAVNTKTRRGWRGPEREAQDEQPTAPPAAQPPPLVEDLDADDDDVDYVGESAGTEPAAAADLHGGADDALGLYLRQMGAIPLLNRAQELALATRLEAARVRFRHAALSSGRVLGKVVEMFERVRSGQLAIDPVIDVVNSLGLTRERILARLPRHLAALKRLLTVYRKEFRDSLRAESESAQHRWRRRLWRLTHKAGKLAEELSPRTEILERWVEELFA